MKRIIFRSLSVLVLLALMILALSGCDGLWGDSDSGEQAVQEGTSELDAVPGEDQPDDRALIFSAEGVTVKADALVTEDGTPSLALYFENNTGEETAWVVDTLTLDGIQIPLGSVCAIPAGERSTYTFPLESPMISMFLKAGEHTVSVSSTLADVSGNTLAQAESDTITVRFG